MFVPAGLGGQCVAEMWLDVEALAFEDAGEAWADHLIADAAPADGLAEQRAEEIPSEEERDDGCERGPDPAPFVEFGFPFGEQVAKDDGAYGAFGGGEQGNDERYDGKLNPRIAGNHC